MWLRIYHHLCAPIDLSIGESFAGRLPPLSKSSFSEEHAVFAFPEFIFGRNNNI